MTRDERLIEINQMFESAKTIKSQLPVMLPNGASVSALQVKCHNCHIDITQEQQRGDIRPVAGGAFAVTGYGYCAACHLLTPFHYHILTNGTGFQLVTRKGRTPFDEMGTVIPFKKGA